MIHFLAQATENISQSLFSGWDPSVVTGGTAAAALAAIWVFFKAIRAVVATLFMLCVVFLVLKVCFDIDLSTWLRPVFESILSGNL